MKRREFMVLSGSAVAWPFTVRAQEALGQRLIGVLSPITKAAALRNVEALQAGLRELLAPLHSITSSASSSIEGGTVRPRAFAVFTLMTNSNLVGCCTGRSPGFSPLRMRPT